MTHTSESVQAWLGYLFVGELAALKMLAHGLPANPVVVNIGAGGGTSGLAFKESRSDLTLITIDIQEESSPFGCLQGERAAMESAGFRLGDGWFQIHGDSKRVGQQWGLRGSERINAALGFDYGPVDLVFVDGDHSYDGCRGDIEAWLPNIKPGGWLAVHDYRKGELDWSSNGQTKPHWRAWPGVDRAVDELLAGRYEQAMRVDSLIVFRVP